MFDYLAVKSYFNKWTKLSIGIDFGIGIDQNSWYRTGIVSKPKKLVSPITKINIKLPFLYTLLTPSKNSKRSRDKCYATNVPNMTSHLSLKRHMAGKLR